MTKATETTGFRLIDLSLEVSKDGSPSVFQFDLKTVFQEINLYDNLFSPCMSGNMLIADATNLAEALNSPNTDKFIRIKVDKGDGTEVLPKYEKKFQIYKVSDGKNINMTSKIYMIYFCSPEYLLSEKLRVSRAFKGIYSDFAKTLLTSSNFLKVPNASPTNGKSGLGVIYPSKGQHTVIPPNISPINAIEWLSYRAVNDNLLPDYVFFENHRFGYNFVSLSYLMDLDPIYTLNFSPKNVSAEGDFEFLGIRRFKTKSYYDLIESLNAGVYGGKFRGLDTLLRKKNDIDIKFNENIFNKMNHTNKNPITPFYRQNTLNKFDARVVTYPYFLPREDNPWVQENDPSSKNFLNNTEQYVFQRKSIFYNLMQRRLELTVPGNFGLASGFNVKLDVPKYSNNRNSDLDPDLSGKYIITGTRHIIRYSIFETMIEVATDSTNKGTGSTTDGADGTELGR